MNRLENNFLEKQTLKPLVWLRYIDDIFFIWTHSEEELKEFMRELNSFDTKSLPMNIVKKEFHF